MEPQFGAKLVTLILASGTPLLLLVVLTIRYLQRRGNRRDQRRKPAHDDSSDQ